MIDLAYATVRWWRVRPDNSYEPPWLVCNALTGVPLVRAWQYWDAIAWCASDGWVIHPDSDKRVLNAIPEITGFLWQQHAQRVVVVTRNECLLLAAERLGRPTRS